MKNYEFKRLLDRYEKGTATKEEIQIIESFYKSMQQNGVSPKEIKNDLGLRNRIYKKIEKKTQKKTTLHRKVLVYSSVAAVCLFFFFASNFLFDNIDEEKQHWIALKNFSYGPKQFILPDSSKVWLSHNSTLQYREDFNKKFRTTKLTGQAFFNITKNLDKPFSILSGDVITKVLGTSFNINQNDTLIEVSVNTGLVNVRVKNENIKLKPNQKIIYKTKQKHLIRSNTNAQLQQLWFKGEIRLDEVELVQLAEVLQDIYGKSFLFKDDKAKKVILYSLRIKKDESLKSLMKRVNFINEVQLKLNNSMIEITKR